MPRVAKAPQRTVLRFQRSVHLEKDHSDASGLSGYIVTACARRALARVATTLSEASSGRAWTLTGPYGTGKSAFSLFLSHVLAPSSEPGARVARELLQRADPALARQVHDSIGQKAGLVPVAVTAAREPLAQAIARGLAATTSRYRIPAARRLQQRLREAETDARIDLIGLLEETSELLARHQKARGILLVIDELGKLLEYAAANPTKSDVYLLQRLAEHATRAKTPLFLVGVLHQDFGGYTRNLSAVEKQEWEKVRGRFEDIVFEDSADELLRLIAQAWTETRTVEQIPGARPTNRTVRDLCEQPWRLGIAPAALDNKKGPDLLAQCLPLHPGVSLLVGATFKRYGQNERSAFSFLNSHEPHSLLDHVRRKPTSLYGLSDFYGYLAATVGDGLVSNRDGKRWAEAFDIEAKLGEQSPAELAAFRTIALLGIVGRWYGIHATADVIRFMMAPDYGAEEVDQAVRNLQGRSAVVFRRFNQTFNLWEGSDVDVDARMSAARADLPSSVLSAKLLSDHFATRPLVARRHSYQTGTLRYFEITYTCAELFSDSLAALDQTPADGHILAVLPGNDPRQVQAFERLAEAHAARPDLLVVLPANAREVESLARDLACISWVRTKTPELAHDAAARRELQALEAEIRRRLEQELASLLIPRAESGRCRWIHQGRSVRVRDLRELNELLSDICDEHYHLAPTVQNEIINRRELSSSAAAARRSLIERMITNGGQEDLGITGNPPEKSVYLSVVKELGLHHRSGEGWTFGHNTARVRQDARPLVKAIRSFFDDAHGDALSIDKLFNHLRSTPYGIRDGLLPIILCAALLGNEADVAVYEKGAFLPELDVKAFERLMKDPASFAVRRWHVSGPRAAVFQQLAELLNHEHVSDRVERRDLLDVVKPLMRFARRLDPFAQHTRSLSPHALAVRDVLLTAAEPDRLLFRDLPAACGISPFEYRGRDRSMDTTEFLDAFRRAVGELQRAYENLLKSIADSLGEVLDGSGSGPERRMGLSRRARLVSAVALEAEMKVFVSRVSDDAADERKWAESIASFLTNKHPTLWTDDDRARFDLRLRQLVRAFVSLESLVVTSKDQTGASSLEAIRIAVVGSGIPQAEHVIHLDDEERTRVSELESSFMHELDRHTNGTRKLALAALARITHRLIAETTAPVETR